jgi:mannose-6-phosphate isomerase-like protein (cupin superfamily)
MGWSDVGSWDAVGDLLPHDPEGNAIIGRCTQIDSRNCTVIGSNRQIATLDVEDLLIIDTEDALLVAKKGSSERVKHVVECLQKSGAPEAQVATIRHRPWGFFSIVTESPGYEIRRVAIFPGEAMATQKHSDRSEHWVVIQGLGSAKIGDQVTSLCPGQSIPIPLGEKHSLRNEGEELLVLIETQVFQVTDYDPVQQPSKINSPQRSI